MRAMYALLSYCMSLLVGLLLRRFNARPDLSVQHSSRRQTPPPGRASPLLALDAATCACAVQIPSVLAAGLDIRCQQVVCRVCQAGGLVTATTATGQAYSARRAVVTVPLGVLRAGTIQFSPALSTHKLAAIRRLGMGALNKVTLLFER
jgi:monoamine oxidase